MGSRDDSRGRPAFRAVYGLVILVALAFASTWAARAPYFLEPDERAHFDGIAALFDAGRPFKMSLAVPGADVTAQERYLDATIGYRRLRYDPTARVEADYGSPAFVARFDANAPHVSDRLPVAGATLPYVSFLYPSGYYALVAIVMRVADGATHGSLWGDLLAARAIGVVLLSITLVAAAYAFRRTGLTRTQTVLGLVCIGWFPLTSWVAGYVQPDDLSLALVTLTLALVLRTNKPSSRDIVLASSTIASLFFVKQHYALCLWLAVLAYLLPRLGSRDARETIAHIATAFLVPLVAFVVSFRATFAPGLSYGTAALAPRGNGITVEHLVSLARGLRDGLSSAYFGGESFQDYWLRFGERGETLYPGALQSIVHVTALAVLPACALLVIVYQTSVVRRIASIARARSLWIALRLTLGSLPINLYVVTTSFLLLVYAQSGEKIFLEGRYWLPVIVANLAIVVRVARVVRRRWRRRAETVVLATFATCTAIAAVVGLQAIDRAYYAPPKHHLIYALASVLSVASNGRAVDWGDSGASVRAVDRIDVRGFAVDPRTGYPAPSVFASVDGKRRIETSTGKPCREAADVYSDAELLHGCFTLRLQTATLSRGSHEVRFFVTSGRLPPLPIRDRVRFRVTS